MLDDRDEKKLFVARDLTTTQLWVDQRCQWCGEHFRAKQSITLLIPMIPYKKKFKRLRNNYLIHTCEYLTILNRDDINSEDDFLSLLGNHPTPRVSKDDLPPISVQKRVDAFEVVAQRLGFTIKTETNTELKFRIPGNSLTAIIGKRTGQIYLRTKRTSHLEDRIEDIRIQNTLIAGVSELLRGPDPEGTPARWTTDKA